MKDTALHVWQRDPNDSVEKEASAFGNSTFFFLFFSLFLPRFPCPSNVAPHEEKTAKMTHVSTIHPSFFSSFPEAGAEGTFAKLERGTIVRNRATGNQSARFFSRVGEFVVPSRRKGETSPFASASLFSPLFLSFSFSPFLFPSLFAPLRSNLHGNVTFWIPTSITRPSKSTIFRSLWRKFR